MPSASTAPVLALAGAPPAPHRAYRRVRLFHPVRFAVAGLSLVALEVAMVLGLGDLGRAVTTLAVRLLLLTGTPVTTTDEPFLGATLPTVVFTLPVLDYRAILVWLAASAVALLAIAGTRRIPLPLRLILLTNIAVLAASALYILFAGHLGYEAFDFSRLYIRSAVLIWLVAPVFLTALGLALPFSLVEGLGLTTLPLLYDLLVTGVRYAAFVWLLSRLGPVPMPPLYLFFGPLLDVILFVGIFALFAVRLSRRLGRAPGAWA